MTAAASEEVLEASPLRATRPGRSDGGSSARAPRGLWRKRGVLRTWAFPRRPGPPSCRCQTSARRAALVRRRAAARAAHARPAPRRARVPAVARARWREALRLRARGRRQRRGRLSGEGYAQPRAHRRGDPAHGCPCRGACGQARGGRALRPRGPRATAALRATDKVGRGLALRLTGAGAQGGALRRRRVR